MSDTKVSHSDLALIGKNLFSIVTPDGKTIVDKDNIQSLSTPLNEYLETLSKETDYEITVYTSKNELIKTIPVQKSNETPTPVKKENTMSGNHNNGNNSFGDSQINNMLVIEKNRQLDKAEAMIEKLTQELEKSRNRNEELREENNTLTVKVNTAEKEKELALLTANSNHSKTLSGALQDLSKADTIAAIGSVIKAIKSNGDDSSSGASVPEFTGPKSDAYTTIVDSLKKINDEQATKLATIVIALTNGDDGEALDVAYDGIKDQIQDIKQKLQ